MAEPIDLESRAQLRTTLIEQAQVIAELASAQSDVLELTTHPLHFLHELLGEVRDTIHKDVAFKMCEEKGTLRMAFAVEGYRWRTFEVTQADYDKAFDQFLAEVKAAMVKDLPPDPNTQDTTHGR